MKRVTNSQKKHLESAINAYSKRRQMKPKYNSITMPNNITGDIGYRCSCYKNYTAVSLENASVDSEIPTTSEVLSIEMALRSNAINNVKSINNRKCVLEEKCTICMQKTKKLSGNKQPVIVCQTYDCIRNLSSFAKILEEGRKAYRYFSR